MLESTFAAVSVSVKAIGTGFAAVPGLLLENAIVAPYLLSAVPAYATPADGEHGGERATDDEFPSQIDSSLG